MMVSNFRFNLAVFAFVLAFLLLAGRSEAASGYWVNGLCQPDQLTAVQSFVSTFPKISNGYLLSVNSSSFVNANTIGSNITASSLSVPVPPQYVWTVATIQPCDTLLQLNPVIDAPSMLYAFTWGFSSIMFFFGLGFAISAGKEAIKKL